MTSAVRMNPKGIRAVLTAEPVQSMIDERGSRIADAAGAGVAAVRRVRRRMRYGNTIRTVTDEGRQRQADGNVIVKAIEAGR